MSHSKLCDPAIAAGDPIPHEAQCRLSGGNSLHGTPQPIGAAEMFYGYGYPYGYGAYSRYGYGYPY